MPDIIAHYRLGASALELLPPDVRAGIDRGVFDHATAGPDIWFSYRFWRPKQQMGKPGRGNEMQHTRTGDFLRALLRAAREGGEAQALLFSYLSGFVCHYCLDKAAHPYITWRTGHYDGTAATLPCRGAHMKMEHALDLWTLRQWGISMRSRPITRRILRLRRLPRAMQARLDGAYKAVYGWDGAFADINTGIGDQRLFYMLTQDRFGLLDAILRRVDDGKSGRDLTAMSFHGKEFTCLDPANERRALWRHPFDLSMESRESFADLCGKAAREAAALITSAWACLRDPAAPEPPFGDASYATGFDWRDARNGGKPVTDAGLFARERGFSGQGSVPRD